MVLIRSLTMVMKVMSIRCLQQTDFMILPMDLNTGVKFLLNRSTTRTTLQDYNQASDLSYSFFGSQYTEPFTTSPVKTHAQPAWTGVFPRPMEAGNRRNHFSDPSGYNPDTVSPFQVSNVNYAPTTTSITLPAGTDLGTNQEAVFL